MRRLIYEARKVEGKLKKEPKIDLQISCKRISSGGKRGRPS
jgi:hypothetical protein